MEGNIEEILAPFRLAVKEQVSHSRFTCVEMGFSSFESQLSTRQLTRQPGSSDRLPLEVSVGKCTVL